MTPSLIHINKSSNQFVFQILEGTQNNINFNVIYVFISV